VVKKIRLRSPGVSAAFGQLDRGRVCVRPEGEERQLGGLFRGCLGELGAPVAGVDHEEPGEPVEVPPALGVPDVGALAADDRGHLPVAVARHPGEVHPEVISDVPHVNDYRIRSAGNASDLVAETQTRNEIRSQAVPQEYVCLRSLR
jgi:hypothetical protein